MKYYVIFQCSMFCFAVHEKDSALVLDDYPSPHICEPIFHMGEWLKLMSE